MAASTRYKRQRAGLGHLEACSEGIQPRYRSRLVQLGPAWLLVPSERLGGNQKTLSQLRASLLQLATSLFDFIVTTPSRLVLHLTTLTVLDTRCSYPWLCGICEADLIAMTPPAATFGPAGMDAVIASPPIASASPCQSTLLLFLLHLCTPVYHSLCEQHISHSYQHHRPEQSYRSLPVGSGQSD